MNRLPSAMVVLLLSVPACVSTAPPRPEAGLTPQFLQQLGLGPVEGVQWQRTIDGVEVVGLSPAPNPAELQLLTAALSELPRSLIDLADTRNIVRDSEVAGMPVEEATLAFSEGPDVFLIRKTFEGIGSTRLGLARVLAHEMTHILQFHYADEKYLEGVISGEVGIIDPNAASSLVREYAKAAGWVDRSNDPLLPAWQLSASGFAGITPYGSTSPAEDMAEAVALVAMGQADVLSRERLAWVEDLLGEKAAVLAKGKPWIPPGSSTVTSSTPIYDPARAAALGKARAEPEYFQLPADLPDAAGMAATITEQLNSRGLAGSLDPVDDPRLPRYAGSFLRGGGVTYWVELWDFRDAGTSLQAPVLSYVTLW